jgi:glycosyltransferase involved in cell wall biosynthesis
LRTEAAWREQPRGRREPRVLIVAEHASAGFGGEATLPLQYFRELLRRGVDVRMIIHARSHGELRRLFPEHAGAFRFIPDTRLHRALCRAGKLLPPALNTLTLSYASHVYTQWLARREARRLIASGVVDIVHQPIPVSPREPSLLRGLGVPVVIGPMNGAMSYPPAFADMEGAATRLARVLVSRTAAALNRVAPGKNAASTLLVANERTRRALPIGDDFEGRVVELIENGVDTDLFRPRSAPRRSGPLRFVAMERFADFKATDLMIEAFARADLPPDATLDLIGDGLERARLEQLSRDLGVSRRARFAGWLTREQAARHLQGADVFLMSSLRDCGGAVVLEAMACALPVVVTAWGGPLDYVDPTCGMMIEPTDRAALIDGFAQAMARLARDPALRVQLGAAGRRRVVEQFDWQRKVDRMLEIYRDAIERDGRERGEMCSLRASQAARGA